MLAAAIILRNGTTSLAPGKSVEWYSVKDGTVVLPELIAIISTDAWALIKVPTLQLLSEGRRVANIRT